MSRTTAPPHDIPLRLRRRRDGSLALTDANGAVSGTDRAFPPHHFFTFLWLVGDGASVAQTTVDTVTLTLANASAVYRITEVGDVGVSADLVSADMYDAPSIDEAEAARIQSERS